MVVTLDLNLQTTRRLTRCNPATLNPKPETLNPNPKTDSSASAGARLEEDGVEEW